MGISGCTSCQKGGLEALRDYGRDIQVRHERVVAKVGAQAAGVLATSAGNRPVESAVVGSRISIRA
jgi:hypothetical protein